MRKCCCFSLLLFFIIRLSSAQEVYVNVQNSNIYDFLDELANCRIISLNSAIKPYSRVFIAGKLREASNNIIQLNKRQQAELNFYLNDYNKELQGFETTDYLGKNIIFEE